MQRLARLFGLAAAAAALVTGLTAGATFAAGSPVVGHVYVNNNTPGRNTVAGFDRHADGSLTPIPGSPFDAGGAGTGSPFGSAGGLQETADGRYLLATDPASDTISVLRIKPDGGLQLADVEGSNGNLPTSIAVHGSLVYVANGGAGGSNYTGFRLNAGGRLAAIAVSTYALPDNALPNGPIRWAGNGEPGAAVRRPSAPIRNASRNDGPAFGPTRVPTRRSPSGLIRTWPGRASSGRATVEPAIGLRWPPAFSRKPV